MIHVFLLLMLAGFLACALNGFKFGAIVIGAFLVGCLLGLR